MLKPALARRTAHCIGATTLDEYRKYVEKDAALERRFQKVLVDEPSVEATIAILRGLQEKYEVHHGVEITDPAIVAAAELSTATSPTASLPDKAIDLVDEAAAKVEIELDSKPEVMDKLDRGDHPAQDRARGGQAREGRGVEEAPRPDRGRDRSSSEAADLEEIWKSEKATAQGSAHLKEEIDRLRTRSREFTRKGDSTRSPSCSTAGCPSWKATEGRAGQGDEQGRRRARMAASRSCCVRWSAPRRLPRWWRGRPASRCPN